MQIFPEAYFLSHQFPHPSNSLYMLTHWLCSYKVKLLQEFIEEAQYRWSLNGLGRFKLSEKCGKQPGEVKMTNVPWGQASLPLNHSFIFITSFSKHFLSSYSGSNTCLSMGEVIHQPQSLPLRFSQTYRLSHRQLPIYGLNRYRVGIGCREAKTYLRWTRFRKF